MLEFYLRFAPDSVVHIDGEVMLNHLQREKGRFKAYTNSGDEMRVFLERGHTLAIGEILRSECGQNVIVVGALESVITAVTDDPVLFSQACYHLGNRHVKVQIGGGWLRFSPDHVLEDMLIKLGMQLEAEQAVFVPERGAYSNHGKQDSHDHHH